MFRNALISTLRNLARNRLQTSINLLGLTIAFSTAILIGLLVRDELSFDRFYPNHERTFRVTPSGPGNPESSPAELAANLALAFPQIEVVTRVWPASVLVKRGDVEAIEIVFWSDRNVFDVLPRPAVAGDLRTALEKPDAVVLTRRLAQKYFGREDVVGQILTVDRQYPMRIAAVIEDTPSNTHLPAEFFVAGHAAFSPMAQADGPRQPGISNPWLAFTYVRLNSAAAVDAIRPGLDDFVKERVPWLQHAIPFTIDPIAALHLHPKWRGALKPAGRRDTVLAIASVGVLVLLIAGINFVNLMTARASRRAIEVGVRKVTGAGRRQLAVQFIGEALIQVMVAAVVAFAFVELILPVFNAFLQRKIAFDYWRDPELLAATVGLMLILGTLAGTYPAFVLSSFRPAAALQARSAALTGSGTVRQALVILQFAILIGLILATWVVYRQLSFAMSESVRFKEDKVLFIGTSCRNAFEDAVRALPGVRRVACSFQLPLAISFPMPIRRADGSQFNIFYNPVDFGFFEMYGIAPVAGRLFSKEFAADIVPSDSDTNMQAVDRVVINETASRALGYADPRTAIGNRFQWARIHRPNGQFTVLHFAEVIGVVPDFLMGSIRSKIEPAAFYVNPLYFTKMNVELAGAAIPETVREIEQLWKEYGQTGPMPRYFLDQQVQALYLDVIRQGILFGVFGLVVLFVACLGLFGLSAFTAERRTKEIGIRKAMGAGTRDIAWLLLWQFTKPVAFANLIAWPVGAYLMHRWLQGFAYRIELEPTGFVVAGAAALVIAWLTVLAHVLRVARARPVGALRYE